MKCLLAVCHCLACCLALAGVSRADPPEKPQAAPARGKLTNEELGEMLRNFGYETSTSKSMDGKLTYYRVDIDHGDFRYIVYATVLEAQNKVRFQLPLGTVAEPEKVPAEQLWKLLEENAKIMPMSFYYLSGSKQFQLNCDVENRELTPVRLRKELDETLKVAKRTYALWDTNKWPGGPTPAKPVESAKEGKTP